MTKVKTSHVTREAWLRSLAEYAAPWFEEAGAPLPEVRLSVGFSSKGARSNRIGECWSADGIADGIAQVFVHPRLGSAQEVGHIVVHELLHAAVGPEAGHGHGFRRPALALGLAGKMTATHAGPVLEARLAEAFEAIGPYPHTALQTGAGAQRKQTTRMIKCQCGGCGYLVRTTAKWIDVAVPTCPDFDCAWHGVPLEVG
jgi:hypothetical protein